MRIRGRWVAIQLECSANLSTCHRTHCRCFAPRKPCLSVGGRHHPAHQAGEIRPSDRSSWVDLYKEIRSTTTTMSHSEVPCLLRGRLRMSGRGSLALWTRSSTRMASSTSRYCSILHDEFWIWSGIRNITRTGNHAIPVDRSDRNRPVN